MSTQSVTWLDGVPASALPLPDRGVDFGDSLFETLLLKNGTPLYPELHLERLERGLGVLGIPDCLETVRSHLQAVARDVHDRQWQWCALRLSVVRGAGPRGYAPDPTAIPRVVVRATQLERDCSEMAPAALVCIANVRLSQQPLLAGLKHGNRLEQVLAAADVCAQDCDEGLMLDGAGRLACMTAGNVFLVRGDDILTPPLIECGVHGTRRRLVLERWAGEVGKRAHTAELKAADLESADEVFYTSSLYTLRPVAGVGSLRWDHHPVCEALFECFRGELL